MCWVPLHVTEGPVIASGAGVCLGRDFLSTVRLDYDGPNGQATVTW
jgi:hypothetical protein